MMGIQQHLPLRRGSMESSLYHPDGTLWTHCHVPWLLQRPTHLPGIHEPYFCRHAYWEMAQNLHGWLRNSHQGWPSPSSWENSMNTPTTLRTWSHCETLQNGLQHLKNGIPRDDHQTRKSRNGWEEAWSHPSLETPYHSKSSQVVHQIHQLLSKIHPELLQYCCPPQSSNKKEWALELDFIATMAFDKLKHIFSSAPILQIPDITQPFSIMMDASLLVAGVVLLQTDTNKDLHPCTYFLCTFSAAQWNYDIYDRELLAVILALEEWHQYLQGTQHPITIITDHKNLSYVKDPHKPSQRQAWWSLFLQDFNLVWQVIPGTKMAPADALSRRDSLNTSLDNAAVAICPEPVVINTLDLALTCHIQSSFQSNPLILKAIESLWKGSPLFLHSLLNDWKFEDGCLYFKGRMHIPPEPCHALVTSLHYSTTLGHVGQFHTKAFLECDFWWPGLSTYVNNFIAGCTTCQQNKVNTHLTCTPLNPISSSSSLLFKQLSVDLVTDLPLAQGFDSLMVIVNHGLTKGVVIIPCSKIIDAAGVGKLFFQNIFKWFGLHDSIISDWGPQFASALARELAWLLKYNVQLSTTYHPQTDGQTERTNQEIETYLHIFCTNNPHSWPDLLPTAEFLHNSAPHHPTKTFPFLLLLGDEFQAYPSLGKTFLLALENHMATLKEARKEALATHETAQQIIKDWITRNFSLWKVGDKVWLEMNNLCLHYPSQKLAPKRLGPFKISQVLFPLTYHLRLPSTWKIYDVFHATLLTPYWKMTMHGPNFSSPPPDLIGPKEEYKVERIVSHCGSSGKHQYLIAWKG